MVIFDRLPQFFDVAPTRQMLLFSGFANDFSADLALGRVPIACDCVGRHLFRCHLLPAVRARHHFVFSSGLVVRVAAADLLTRRLQLGRGPWPLCAAQLAESS